MKKLCLILLSALLLSSAQAITSINALITITNPPTGTLMEQISLQGTLYTWTNSASIYGQIQSTNSLQYTTTNLFNRLNTDYSSILRFSYTSPTNISISTYVNGTLTITNTLNWMTVVFTTNTPAAGDLTSMTESNFTATHSITLNGITITSWPGVGGAATNVFFGNGASTQWRLSNGTNYFDIPAGTFDLFGTNYLGYKAATNTAGGYVTSLMSGLNTWTGLTNNYTGEVDANSIGIGSSIYASNGTITAKNILPSNTGILNINLGGGYLTGNSINVGSIIGAAISGVFSGDGSGLTNLNVATQALNKLNVSTNLNISGVSQEGIYTNWIWLQGFANSAENTVYKDNGLGWFTSAGGFYIVTNVGGQFRLEDTNLNIYHYRNTTPLGQWSDNLESGSGVGDWGRIEDFSVSGNSGSRHFSNFNATGVSLSGHFRPAASLKIWLQPIPYGNDSNSGSSESDAVATFTNALNIANNINQTNQSVIWVSTYTNYVFVPTNSLQLTNIIVAGDGSGTLIFDTSSNNTSVLALPFPVLSTFGTNYFLNLKISQISTINQQSLFGFGNSTINQPTTPVGLIVRGCNITGYADFLHGEVTSSFSAGAGAMIATNKWFIDISDNDILENQAIGVLNGWQNMSGGFHNNRRLCASNWVSVASTTTKPTRLFEVNPGTKTSIPYYFNAMTSVPLKIENNDMQLSDVIINTGTVPTSESRVVWTISGQTVTNGAIKVLFANNTIDVSGVTNGTSVYQDFISNLQGAIGLAGNNTKIPVGPFTFADSTSVQIPTLLATVEDFTTLTINQYYTNTSLQTASLDVDEVLTADASHAASLGFYISTNANSTWTNFRTNSDAATIAGAQTKPVHEIILPGWVYMVTNLDASGIVAPSAVTYTHRSYH